MGSLRNAIRSAVSLRTVKPSYGLPPFLRESPKRFSTETEQPAPPPSRYDSSVDQFIQYANTGFTYGKLLGITGRTLKTDVVQLLEGCNLTTDDVRVIYNRSLSMPLAMLVRFASPTAYSDALRTIRKYRFYRLERVNMDVWDTTKPYDGKSVLLEGIPPNALLDDVERFLSGCDYDSSATQIFINPGVSGRTKSAIVRFPSQIQAMNAFITKNRRLCLNNQISVQVLQ